jgi:hypothetical protein
VKVDRGGLSYSLPLSELPPLAALLRRGATWAQRNGIELDPALVARLRDLEVTVEMMRPLRAQPDAVPGPLRAETMGEMGGCGSREVGTGAAARLAGCTRQALSKRLRAGRIPGAWRDDQGRWRIPIDALEAKGA